MIKVGDRIRYKNCNAVYQLEGLVIYIRGEQVYYLSQNSIRSYAWDYIDYLETINDLEVV